MNEILKKRIEEAAGKSSFKYLSQDGIEELELECHYNAGFIEGAEYALSHQWISVDEALPDNNEICLFIDNHGKMQLLTMDDIRKQHEIWDAMFMGVSRDSLEESICLLDKIIAWLPIPKFKTEEKKGKQ